MRKEPGLGRLSCQLTWITLAALITNCSPQTPTLDVPQLTVPTPTPFTLKTPISESTIQAFREGSPVTDANQAVVAARFGLRHTRIQENQPPEIVGVQRLEFQDALNRIPHREGNINLYKFLGRSVWLVELRGSWSIQIPGERSPRPYQEGMLYVIVDANTGQRLVP